jgi:hypothetical protein
MAPQLHRREQSGEDAESPEKLILDIRHVQVVSKHNPILDMGVQNGLGAHILATFGAAYLVAQPDVFQPDEGRVANQYPPYQLYNLVTAHGECAP